MTTSISILEQQLAELRAKNGGYIPPVNMIQPEIEPNIEPVVNLGSQMVTMSRDDLQALIKETVQLEISKNIIPEKEYSLEDALEIVLTKEERLYFVNPEAMKKIPNFIVSAKGKSIVRQFVDEFLKGNN